MGGVHQIWRNIAEFSFINVTYLLIIGNRIIAQIMRIVGGCRMCHIDVCIIDERKLWLPTGHMCYHDNYWSPWPLFHT